VDQARGAGRTSILGTGARRTPAGRIAPAPAPDRNSARWLRRPHRARAGRPPRPGGRRLPRSSPACRSTRRTRTAAA